MGRSGAGRKDDERGGACDVSRETGVERFVFVLSLPDSTKRHPLHPSSRRTFVRSNRYELTARATHWLQHNYRGKVPHTVAILDEAMAGLKLSAAAGAR